MTFELVIDSCDTPSFEQGAVRQMILSEFLSEAMFFFFKVF